jgi:hypothetical protein
MFIITKKRAHITEEDCPSTSNGPREWHEMDLESGMCLKKYE